MMYKHTSTVYACGFGFLKADHVYLNSWIEMSDQMLASACYESWQNEEWVTTQDIGRIFYIPIMKTLKVCGVMKLEEAFKCDWIPILKDLYAFLEICSLVCTAYVSKNW